MAREIPSPHSFREPTNTPAATVTQPSTPEIEAQNARATEAWLDAQKLRALAPKMNRKARRQGAAEARSAEFKRLLKAAKRDAVAFINAQAAKGEMPKTDEQLMEAVALQALSTRQALVSKK